LVYRAHCRRIPNTPDAPVYKLYYSTFTRKRGHVNCLYSIKGKQLPAHSVSIEIYSGTARFRCDSTALVIISRPYLVRSRLCDRLASVCRRL